MGTLLLNSEHEIRSIFNENKTEVVTLLIPDSTLSRLEEKEKRTLSRRIPILLIRYGKYLTSIKRLGKNAGKTLYQPSTGRSKMKRMNVRVGKASWTLLGVLAQTHGVSRCYLFNYLLWLDEIGVGSSIVNIMNEGAPTFHRNYRYILHVDFPKNRISRSLESEPSHLFSILDYRDWF
ncbi:CopG family transcriptional regulator [Leptospira tipperaryensis]|uniref:CopG family transcriptional regulator n=1 Tax=Leptospira tipperaryensis TaxID=2564040 RepID=A0A1D7UX43_9LEPT|nr:DUF1564 domain-containing protein [Leptospira tipperaryensis]AOP34111.1 CopG family transcriptional regulator [Leptospira tipperaryensis]